MDNFYEGLSPVDEATLGGWQRAVSTPPKPGEVIAITAHGDVFQAVAG